MKSLVILSLLLVTSVATLAQRKYVAPKSVEERLNEEYCSGLFATREGIYFDMLNDNAAASASGYLNILDWLNGRVAGLRVVTTWDNVKIPYIRNSRASVYVNELLVNPDFLNLLPSSDIAMIKVIKAPYAGFGGPGGVVAVYTIGGEEDED